MDNQLTVKQKELITNFNEILRYGYAKMSTIPLQLDKVKLRKKIMFLMMAAVQSYSEAIFKLMNPPGIYDKASEVLFRSIVETYINYNFIVIGRTQINALVFLLVSLTDKKDFAEKYRSFMLKYPSWNISFARIKTPQDWDKFIQDLEKDMVRIEKRYQNKFPDLPKIRNRAEAVDNEKRKNKRLNRKNSLEFYYVQYYKFFSQITHLTMPGLERFITFDQTGNVHLDIDSKHEDIERIIPITYILYFVMLRHTLKQFNAFDKKDFEQFDKYSKSLSGE